MMSERTAMNNPVPFAGLAIGGKRTASSDGNTTTPRNPSSLAPIVGDVPAPDDDAARAVCIAHERFSAGRWMPLLRWARGQLLQRIANLVRERAETLAQIESQN